MSRHPSFIDTKIPDGENSSPEQQLQRVWESVLEQNRRTEQELNCPSSNHASGITTTKSTLNVQWPTYDFLMKTVAVASYEDVLTCPFDTRSREQKKSKKALSANGVLCQVKMVFFEAPTDVQPYTGLLAPGKSVEHCLLRLSSACKPPTNENVKTIAERILTKASPQRMRDAKFIPLAGLKVFRSNNERSGNLLFGGSKIGQQEEDYFARSQCTHLTEKIPKLFLPIARNFFRYSDFPLSLGCSEFCSRDEVGNKHSRINFPFAITLKPVYQQRSPPGPEEDPFVAFIEDALKIPVGTVLYDIYASVNPQVADDPTKLQRIGRLVTQSEIIISGPDDGVFFRHQKKEDDYDLRPHWKKGIEREIKMDDGQTKGTLRKLMGWKLVEQHIRTGQYRNFEASPH